MASLHLIFAMRSRVLLLHRHTARCLHLKRINASLALPPANAASLLPPFLPFRSHRRLSTACNSYSSPDVYDIAFSFRDFETEVAFLLAAQAAYGSGPFSRFLEIGCGPARHSILLAQATGAECIGLDVSPKMLAYAANRAEEAGVASKVVFLHADMTADDGIAQSLPGGPVDVIAVLLGTLSHCLDNVAALRCFNNLAGAVRPGGLLILELSHPGELFGGSFTDPLDFVDCWEAAENGEVEFAEKRENRRSSAPGDRLAEGEGDGEKGSSEEDESDTEEVEEDVDKEDRMAGMRRVLVEYGRDGDHFDLATQVLHRTVGLSLFDSSGEMVSSEVSVVPQRQFSLQEVDLLGRATGWEVVGVRGDLADDVPLEGEDAYRMVVVLKRK